MLAPSATLTVSTTACIRFCEFLTNTSVFSWSSGESSINGQIYEHYFFSIDCTSKIMLAARREGVESECTHSKCFVIMIDN